ncbi:MAG: hypothetical protein KJ697_02010 [Nanoarchaeota archaeon]|nr:hypothetical protein [Nanoarchaeota archaeon]
MVQPIVSHATYIAIGIIAILMILSSLYSFKDNIESVDNTAKLNHIADIIQKNVILHSFESPDFQAKMKVSGPQNVLVSLQNNFIEVKGYDMTISRSVDMKMSGDAYLPAYLIFLENEAMIE